VVRPPPAPSGRQDVFAAAAKPLLDLSAAAARAPRPDPAAVATEARRLAEAFETAALRAGAPRAAVGDARDGLLAVLDARTLGNPALRPGAWEAARRRALPGVEDLSAGTLRRRLAAAEAAGPPGRDLARFLRHCLEAVEAAPPPRAGGPRWGLIAPLLLVAVLAAWAGWAEWRFRAGLLAAMAGPEAVARAAGAGPAAAARQLDALAAAADEVAARAPGSPLGLVQHLGPLGPAAAARARYAGAADALLPPHLDAALATALATEGGSLALYDTLRALAILEGRAPWQPAYLAGWLAARAAADPALGPLAAHATALSGPPPGLAAQDPELLAQARAIAADGDPAAFAFLELARSEAARALPEWSPPEAVPGIELVLVRRSGRPLAEGIPGLLTAVGWDHAAGGGAAAAIARAAEEGAGVLGRDLTAIPEAALMEELQRRTLDAWTEHLSDLRVKPFTDQPGSVLISGTLGRTASPLETLFREVWRQVGGEDRGRSHPDQLRIAAAFGPMIQFVEQGRMAEISRLFAALNVALAALDADAEVGRRRVMDVQARAASVAALTQAPRLVGQIVEDVLAQTVAAQGGPGRPRAALAWERELGGACRAALGGAYPFGPGPDADLAAVADLLAPGGRIARFLADELAPIMDVEQIPWRWKPEARLSGFTPESAAFFERAAAVGDALFPPEGVALTLTALAQRGAATVTLGGVPAPVTTTGEPAALAWPGPDPAQGLQVAFATAAGDEREAWPGPWGLLRFLDGLRLRARDGGQRFLLDVSLPTTRAYLQLAFDRPANPAAARALLAGLTCPPTL
jgi:type VI protein secretion system component VasK